MYSDWAGPVPYGAGFLAVFVWLGIISILVWQQQKFLKSLFPKEGSRDIRKKFEEVTGVVGDFKRELGELDSKVTAVGNKGRKALQKVELNRFNPYNDTGGDQSFTVALLDNEGSGVVVTSLHARNGTRVFGKEVVAGKTSKYQLSKEEEVVIKKAMSK